MARLIDADKLLDDITAIENSSGMGYIIASTFKRYVNQQPTLTPPNEPLTCAGCYYLDGQCAPCAHCRRAAGYADYYRRLPEGEL